MSSVWPSGGDFETSAIARLPVAPGRLSTTTFWLSRGPSEPAAVRARRSVTPPGDVPATRRIGGGGEPGRAAARAAERSRHEAADCAWAVGASNSASARGGNRWQVIVGSFTWFPNTCTYLKKKSLATDTRR